MKTDDRNLVMAPHQEHDTVNMSLCSFSIDGTLNKFEQFEKLPMA
jgi:hypothetical protein